MKHPRLAGGPIVVLLVLAAPTSIGAEESEYDRFRDRFQLWNACQPMDLVIESLDDDDVKMGLTHEAITTAVRSRLRAARLYRSESRTYLYVNVNVLSGETRVRAFSVSVEFKKWLLDPQLDGQGGLVSTWDTTAVGWGDVAYILSAVSQYADRFIDEYLRVNEPACQS